MPARFASMPFRPGPDDVPVQVELHRANRIVGLSWPNYDSRRALCFRDEVLFEITDEVAAGPATETPLSGIAVPGPGSAVD